MEEQSQMTGWLTVPEVVEKTGISRNVVDRALRRGILPYARFVRGGYRYCKLEDVDEWIEDSFKRD